MSDKIERRGFLKFLLTSGIVLTGAGTMPFLFSNCERGEKVAINTTYDFLDHLNEAKIITPRKEYVKKTSFTINGETKKNQKTNSHF